MILPGVSALPPLCCSTVNQWSNPARKVLQQVCKQNKINKKTKWIRRTRWRIGTNKSLMFRPVSGCILVHYNTTSEGTFSALTSQNVCSNFSYNLWWAMKTVNESICYSSVIVLWGNYFNEMAIAMESFSGREQNELHLIWHALMHLTI